VGDRLPKWLRPIVTLREWMEAEVLQIGWQYLSCFEGSIDPKLKFYNLLRVQKLN